MDQNSTMNSANTGGGMMDRPNFFHKNKTWIIVLVIALLLGAWAISKKNTFVVQNEAITAQWAQVENQYKRRFDLIPNIVATVKGVAKQEEAIFTAIAEARTRYAGARTVDERATAATQVESALGRLLVITENYPVLQSSQAYRDLIVTLEGTENRISVERMKYNDQVRIYDTNIKTFPTSIVASLFGMKEHAYFEASATEQTNPTVNF